MQKNLLFQKHFCITRFKTFYFFSDCFLIIMLRWSGPYIGSTLNNQPLIHIYIHIYTIGSLVERFFLLFGAKLLSLDGIITEFFLTDYYWKISFFSIFLLTLVRSLLQVYWFLWDFFSSLYNCYIFLIFGILVPNRKILKFDKKYKKTIKNLVNYFYSQLKRRIFLKIDFHLSKPIYTR